MILSHTGEARVRGYLYVFERSMRSSLPQDVVADAVREVESHIRERITETEPVPDERAALERVLAALGNPTRVARGYSLELSVEEALVTGRVSSMLRVIWLMASTTVGGFVAALFLFTGYVAGFAFLATAVMTMVWPGQVGLVLVQGIPSGFGSRPLRPGIEIVSEWWVVVICIVAGLGFLVLTHKGARAWIRWIRTRIRRKESI